MRNDIALVTAVDDEYGIGKDGAMPWHNKDDFKWFRTLTTYPFVEGKPNAVVMGYNTWKSLPGPLKDRVNVVISHSGKVDGATEEVRVFANLSVALKTISGVGKVFVIGGGSVYGQSLTIPEVSEIYVTKLDGTHKCDTFFPMGSALDLGFVTYDRLSFRSLSIQLMTRYSREDLIFKTQTPNGILINK